MKELYELKEKLCDELKEYGKKEMSAGSLDVVDKLAHTIKNLDKIIDCYDGDYRASNRGSYRGSYDRGESYGYGMHNGDSYARGCGYSRHGLKDKLRELMDEAPDEKSRMEIQRLVDKME